MASQSLSNEIVIHGDHALLPGARAIVQMEGFDDAPALISSSPIIKPSSYGSGNSGVIPWGVSNNQPQYVISTVNKSAETRSLLDFYVSMLFGNGVVPEVPTGKTDQQGNPIYKLCEDPEILDWIEFNNVDEHFLESCIDHAFFENNFEELIKSKSGNKIAQVVHQESAFSRYLKRNDKGIITHVVLNANWPEANANDDYSIHVPRIDRYHPGRYEMVRQSKSLNFIYDFSYSSPGKVDYQSPGWHAILESWLPVATAIPLYKIALMKNQMTIKYHIRVPQGFWIMQAKDRLDMDWKKMTPDQKKALRTTVLNEMNEFLTDVKNTGKAWISTFGTNNEGKMVDGVEIKTLDDKLQDGKYLEDSQEASAHIIRAIGGLTPAVVGHFTGKGMGSGSGSDARIHFNILNNRLAPRKKMLLQPYEFVSTFNGWKERLKGFRWRVKDFQLDTLDKNHQTTNEGNGATN